MVITLIGSGNVATVLGRKILAAGHRIAQVISRHEAHARLLAEELDGDFSTDVEKISLQADIYILAVSDSSLFDLVKVIHLENKLAVHTAGSVSKEILSRVTKNFGVLYPLQTLRKEVHSDFTIPLLIDANTEETMSVIGDFANTLSDSVRIADDEQRMQLHVAATVVNNFSNYLFTLTEIYCINQKIDFKLLAPLIEETARRAEQFSPSQMQTGPAIRNDLLTIRAHLELLAKFPELRKLYEVFTDSIQRSQNTEQGFAG